MRRTALRLAVAAPLLLGPACGGSSSPSTPSPTPTPTPANQPQAPAAIDGWSEALLQAVATPAIVSSGDRVAVTASGYLAREQLFSGAPIALWPANPSYVRELVYDWELGDGSMAMVRWTGPFTVTLEADLAADAAIVARAEEVVREISRWTGFAISLGPGGAVDIILDPTFEDEGAVAEARVTLVGARITAATVAFAHQRELAGGPNADFSNTLLHEMGHVIGLAHSPDPSDVMTPGAGPGTFFQEYQHNETIALHLMYIHRSPGNRHPDTDVGLAAAARAGSRVVVIRD